MKPGKRERVRKLIKVSKPVPKEEIGEGILATSRRSSQGMKPNAIVSGKEEKDRTLGI